MHDALICKAGGYVSMRHNKLRDLTGELLSAAGCKDVKIEPQLLPLSGEVLPPGSNKSELAQLDGREWKRGMGTIRQSVL